MRLKEEDERSTSKYKEKVQKLLNPLRHQVKIKKENINKIIKTHTDLIEISLSKS